MYSGDMKSSAIINQTPCRGGQCLNIGDQRESQGGIHEFHSPTSWPPPQLDGATHHRQTAGWGLALLITHTLPPWHVFIMRLPQQRKGSMNKSVYICSYPSIGVKSSPSQEVWLLAKDFFSLLLHPSQLQEWIHLATNLHFYAWKSSFQCQDQDPILYLLLNHREVVGPPPGCCSQVIQSSPAGSRPLQSCLMIYFFGNHGSVIVLLSFH